MVAKTQQIVLLCLIGAAIIQESSCNCPVYGCTPSHSFYSETDFFNPTFTPKLQWSFQSPGLRPTGAGCVTNAARVVCPMAEEDRTVMISWDAIDNGRTPWNITMKTNTALPVIDSSGEVIACDGHALYGCNADGTPFGKPIQLYPVIGEVFDLTVSMDRFLIMLYKCGFFPVYFTNGIPHASIWLNDTVNGINGTFIPLDNPAITPHGRLYVITVFRPFESSTKYSPLLNPYVRLYAIDVRDVAVERIKIIWHYDLTLSGSSIPYVLSKTTMCAFKPPPVPPQLRNKEFVNSYYVQGQDSVEPIASVLVHNTTILAMFNFYRSNDTSTKKTTSQNMYSRLIAVTDKGNEPSLLFSKEFTDQFHSVTIPATGHEVDSSLWISMYESDTGNSFVNELDLLTGNIEDKVDISNLLQTKVARITTKLTTLSSVKRNSSVVMPMVFGVLITDSKSNLVAIDIAKSSSGHGQTGLKVLWMVPLLSNQPSVGQISTVNEARTSSLIITDSVDHVMVYKLANA